MNQKPYFIKKRLSQFIAAGLISGIGMAAHAGDFNLTGNQITISGGDTVGVDVSGVAAHTDLPPSSDGSSLPDRISFGLQVDNSVAGDYFVALQMYINSQTKNNTLNMQLGVAKVTVNAGGTITDVEMVEQGEPNYQEIRITGTKQTNSSTTTLNSTFRARDTMLSFTGGTVSIEVEDVLNHLTGNNSRFDDIIDGFKFADNYNYRIGVQPLSGPSTVVVGHADAGTFTAYPRQNCSAYNVVGTLTIGSPSVDLVPAAAIVENCGVEEPETPLEELLEELNEANNELAALDPASPEAAGAALEAGANAADAAQQLADQANSGEQLNPADVLTSLVVVSTTANLASNVAANTDNTAAQLTLAQQTAAILNNTADVFNTLAEQAETNEYTITAGQQQQVNKIAENIVDSVDNLLETEMSLTDILALADSARNVLEAQIRLGIDANADLIAAVQQTSIDLMTSFVDNLLAEAGQTDLSDAEIRDFLSQATDVLQAVIDASLPLPPSSVESAAQMKTRVEQALAQRSASVPQTGPVTLVPGGNVYSTVLFRDFTPGQALIFALTGRGFDQSLAATAPQILAATAADDINIEVDEVTGAATIELAGESYVGLITAIRTVPDFIPEGLQFLADGRAILTRNGLSVELAPTAIDPLSFLIAADEAGFAPTMRPESASFSLDLGGNQRFVGAFAYDNLTGKDLSNCGDLSFGDPVGAINSPSYAFTATCSNGVSQRVTPFIDNANFFNSVTALGATSTLDRNTGVISVTGLGNFKASFFIDARTNADTAFFNANKDGYGLAYQGGDFNGDGKLDFKVISADSVQLLYGVN